MKRLSSSFFGLLLFVSAVFSGAVQAQNTQAFMVADIRIEGLQRISSGTVFNALPISIGDRASQAAISGAIRSVFATGNFENVAIARDGDVLVVQVEERPSISEINFEGNKAIKTENLLDGLRGAGLYEGQVLRRATLEGMRKELLRQYVGQGRYDAEIIAEVVRQPRNRVAVEVTVDEGNVSRIKSINFVGNELFDDSELRDLLELRDRGWLLWLNGKNKYAKEKFESDISNVETFYYDQGYANFRITDAQVSISGDKKGVFITVVLEEGEKYTFNEVEFSGDLVVDDKLLKPYAENLVGKGFAQTTLSSYEEYFTELAGNIGYTFAEVNAQTTLNDEDKTVDVKFFMNPGKRNYVNRIEFEGNVKTKDEVLRREMRQMEMAPASNARIEQGRVRLNRLGFFKEVNVDTQPTPGADDLVDVVYTVEEQPSGSIGASVGYAQDSGLLLGANLQQNNFLGTGSRVNVGINSSRFQESASFSYTNPYYTEDGVSRGFSVFFRETDYDEINISNFNSSSYGGSINFGYPLSEIERLNFSLGYTHTEIATGGTRDQEIIRSPNPTQIPSTIENPVAGLQVIQGDGAALQFGSLPVVQNTVPLNFDTMTNNEPGFIDINGNVFDTYTVNASYIKSTLNRGQLATRGRQHQLSFEATVPGSDLEYFKLGYRGQAFFPLTKALTLRLSTRLGYGDGYGGTSGLPFFENYYAGGFGSVRGYRANTLGPQSTPPEQLLTAINDSNGDGEVTELDSGIDLVVDDNGEPVLDTNGERQYTISDSSLATAFILNNDGTLATRFLDDNDPFGGNVLMTGSAEVLFPLPFIKDQRTLRSVFFIDAGNVFSTDCGREQVGCHDVDFNHLRYSYGIGINWITGFGPLSFSIARPLNETSIDDREFFQFSLGQNF